MYHEIECGCEHSAHHFPREEWHHHGGCCCWHRSSHAPWGVGHHWECHHIPGYRHRRFLTREEVIAQVEEYLKQLQLEAKGVEERLAELKETGSRQD